MAVRSFFQVSLSDSLGELALSQIGSSSTSQVCIARKLNTVHEQQNVNEKHQIFLEKIRKHVFVQAWKYDIETARKWPSKAYPDHKFVRETVR